jgi:hypothetical protein
MTKHIPILVAAALVAFSFFPTPQPASGPVAAALKSASSSDRAKVRAIYSALADVTARDSAQQMKTLGQWRAVHASALRLAAGGTDLVGKYAGLDKAVDEVLRSHVPTDNVAMTDEVVGKLVAGCKEVVRQSE